MDFKTQGLDADQMEAAIKATLKMLNKIENGKRKWNGLKSFFEQKWRKKRRFQLYKQNSLKTSFYANIFANFVHN